MTDCRSIVRSARNHPYADFSGPIAHIVARSEVQPPRIERLLCRPER